MIALVRRAYLISWSYWEAIRSQRIGRVSAGSSHGQAPESPAAGRYSRVLLIRLIRGGKHSRDPRLTIARGADKSSANRRRRV